jgi:putative Mg2+ transporter-C (MgtC) family protein
LENLFSQTLDVELAHVIAIVVAAVLGGVLGVEREFAGKPAGLRTHIFVCAGSALMMILGQQIVELFAQPPGQSPTQADPIRVLQAIVVGISFLGAGTIVHNEPRGVEGLTTAATIYLTAGIGVATAIEQIPMAVLITVLAVITLVVVGRIEKVIHRHHTRRSAAGKTSETPPERGETP